MDVNRSNCPSCGKPLSHIANGGRIGYCTVHKWQPLVAGAEQEANDHPHLVCPKCLVKAERYAHNGRIGYCAEHLWQPMFPDAVEMAR